MITAGINRTIIKKIARALEELNDQVIYVGGATIGLYINDPAAEDVRPTKDVDISLSLATVGELEILRTALQNKGFIQTAEDDIMCRFRYDDVKVDVMNTTAIGWAPANPWFAPGFAEREAITIEGQRISILPLPYFLASKFSAYRDRGNQEPRTSHDFEDVVYVLDNRTDIAEQILTAPNSVQQFLRTELEDILRDQKKQEAVFSNLPYETRQDRFDRIMDTIRSIIGIIE